MSDAQEFIEWEMLEENNYGTYSYSILRVISRDGKEFYRGWVVSSTRGEEYWQQHDDRNSLRMSLVNTGQQLAQA